jgi:hypothetical protein
MKIFVLFGCVFPRNAYEPQEKVSDVIRPLNQENQWLEDSNLSSSPPECEIDESEKSCLTKLAVYYRDLNYCENFTNGLIGNYYEFLHCYTQTEYEIKDPEICDTIFNDRKNKLTAEELRKNCYYNIAMATKDLSICDFIEDDQFKAECKDQVEIDFSECEPTRKVIYVVFGSTIYEIKGIEGNNCVMDYGGEIENPNWDGRLTKRCSVPLSLGKQIFIKTTDGVDFSSISEFCVTIDWILRYFYD